MEDIRASKGEREIDKRLSSTTEDLATLSL